jgi:serine/threonine protein kinase
MESIAVSRPFLGALQNCGLLTPTQLAPFLATPLPDVDLAQALVRAGHLTEFQANQLLAGKSRGLVLANRYRILQPIGAGGMGQVFLAEHHLMRRRVAVKVLPPRLAADAVLRERFVREARAAAALDHPNIVRAYDVDEGDKVLFLVMEYVAGATLAQLVGQVGPLPVGEACNYITQAAQGLAYAHAHDIVHRDIKPQNLLVTAEGLVKALDLGLAKVGGNDGDGLTRQHNAGDILGTADYMAPEQATSSADTGPAADQYALGCTLFFLLAGKPPFGGRSAAQKLLAHQIKPLPELPDVPAEVFAILQRMTAKQPADRYPTLDDLLIDLAAYATAPPRRNLAALGVAEPSSPSRLSATRLQASPSSISEAPTTIGDPFATLDETTEEDAIPPLAQAVARPFALGWWLKTGSLASVCLAIVFIVAFGGRRVAPPEPTTAEGVPPARETVAPKLDWQRMNHGQFLAAVAKLPLWEQVDLTMLRMRYANQGMAENYELAYGGERPVRLRFNGRDLETLEPLAALTTLQQLLISLDGHKAQSRLADLSPLQKLPLKELVMYHHRNVRDLRPLAQMPLENLQASETGVNNLEPLRGMRTLRSLALNGTPVSNLNPVADLLIDGLAVGWTRVTNFAPLVKLPLKYLDARATSFADAELLRGKPLEHLDLRETPVQNLAGLQNAPLKALWLPDAIIPANYGVLRSLKQLEKLNDHPPADVLKWAHPEPTKDWLFRDTFAAGQPQGWAEVAEGWHTKTLSNQQSVLVSSGSKLERCVVSKQEWTDYEIACSIQVGIGSGKPALLGRCSTQGIGQQHYALFFDPHGLYGGQIYWCLALEELTEQPKWITLAEGKVERPQSNWLRVRFRLHGSALSAAVAEDGVHYRQVFHVQNNQKKDGPAGLKQFGFGKRAVFRNLLVYPIP